MELVKATRQPVKMRLGLVAQSGAGKTLGALRTAFGLCGDWSKVAILDTTNGTANLHSAEGPFNILKLKLPFEPEVFINAIILCEEKGMDVIIVDTVSEEWMGAGGVVEQFCNSHISIPQRWNSVLQMHHELLRTLSESTCHIIVTLREDRYREGEVVQDDVLLDHLHVIFELSANHMVKVVKDRTGMFEGSEPFSLKAETGHQLRQWCNRQSIVVPEELQCRINSCTNMDQLYKLLFATDAMEPEVMNAFVQRRLQLQGFIEDPYPRQRCNEATDNIHGFRVVPFGPDHLTSA